MRSTVLLLGACALLAAPGSRGEAQSPVAPAAASSADSASDPIQQLVARLDLQRYKGTIKELTRFGDRRQGTARNRAALDWIEAQLKSYGCTNTERLTYTYAPPAPRPPGTPAPARDPRVAQGGGRPRGVRAPTG
jgi:hypothetical protein